jgi:hypothetical protein
MRNLFGGDGARHTGGPASSRDSAYNGLRHAMPALVKRHLDPLKETGQHICFAADHVHTVAFIATLVDSDTHLEAFFTLLASGCDPFVRC